MPRGDRTGPLGQGPKTGRGLGYCAGYSAPGFMNQGFGRRFRGFGRGFGRRRQSGPIPPAQPQAYQPTKEQELEMLGDEAKIIEQEQKALEQRLEEIKKRTKELKKEKKA